MQFWSLIPRLLSILVVVSLLTAPRVSPPSGVTMEDAAGGAKADMGSRAEGKPGAGVEGAAAGPT